MRLLIVIICIFMMSAPAFAATQTYTGTLTYMVPFTITQVTPYSLVIKRFALTDRRDASSAISADLNDRTGSSASTPFVSVAPNMSNGCSVLFGDGQSTYQCATNYVLGCVHITAKPSTPITVSVAPQPLSGSRGGSLMWTAPKIYLSSSYNAACGGAQRINNNTPIGSSGTGAALTDVTSADGDLYIAWGIATGGISLTTLHAQDYSGFANILVDY